MPALLSKLQDTPQNKNVRAILAWNVRRLRVQAGWSQEELAARAGLDRTYISALEREIWNVSLGNIEKLAQALSVEPWVLLSPAEEKTSGEQAQ